MRPHLSALFLLLPLACAGDDDGRTSGADTSITTATAATATATATATLATTTGDDPGVTGSGDPDTTAATTSTTAPPQTATSVDPDTTWPGDDTTGPPDPTVDPGTTAAAGTSTGGEPDPLACPSELPQDCSPGDGSGEGDTCVKGTSCFIGLVQQGVKDVIAAHPEWFTDEGGGAYLVLEVELYMNAVVADINENMLCAIRDPNAGDEVAVKHDNGYAESFDILTADGHARYGDLIYTATCAPAWY